MIRTASTLKDWIIEAAAGEPVEAVVLGGMGWGRDYGSEKVPGYGDQPKNRAITWDEALPWISYEFDAGYGAPGCNAIWAWTPNRVIFVSQYDGATGIEWVPRNPIDGEPEMPGG